MRAGQEVGPVKSKWKIWKSKSKFIMELLIESGGTRKLRKMDTEMTTTNPSVSLPGEHQINEKVYPELLSDSNLGFKTVNYMELIPLLLLKMKNMQKEIDNLREQIGTIKNMGTKMTTTIPLVGLPVEIFSNVLEYLGWCDMGRLDTAFLNRDARNSYLFALQLRKVNVEDNEFWDKAVARGIFISWLIRRNIRVISWELVVDNAQLISIANGLLQLQSLNIRCCGNITDEGIRAVASGLPRLQSLNIEYCDNITDEGIRALANGLPQLQSLTINDCGNITDEGISALANGCTQLHSLNISWCTKITDEGVRALASGLLPQLQSLDIHGCDEITDAGIRALASGCRQIQSLNIGGSISNGSNITDEGIRALASGCPQLQSLDIRNCRKITDEGIRALASGCPQLQSLTISNCRKITDEGEEIANRINSRR